MVKRKNVAINFFTDYNSATGLTIYLLNIIKTLKTLEDELKPILTIIYVDSAPIDEIKEIEYPYCNYYLLKVVWINPGILKKIVNKFALPLLRKNLFSGKRGVLNKFPSDIDVIYPYFYFEPADYIKTKLYWKADFQEKYYPQFFSEEELQWSENFLNSISNKEHILVLSSKDALKDYNKFYPNHKNTIKLLRFASFLPEYSSLSIETLKQKFEIDKRFFFIANQFWPHKNHLTVLKAIAHIKDKLNCIVVCSGKTTSHRDPNYFESVRNFIDDNQIADHVKILGFIDRREQLQLMSNSIAIIQPSLFEGWSTVIEDAKAMDKFVIASGLAVNREQAETNAVFFDPLDYLELSQLMLSTQEGLMHHNRISYDSIVDDFRKDIINILQLDN